MKKSTWLIITSEPLLEVEVSANILFDNGDCGNGCNIGESVEVDGDLEYDKSQYSELEIELINDFIFENQNEIENQLIEQ